MENRKFGKTDWLKRRKLIENLFKNGETLKSFPIILKYSKLSLPDNPACQAGFSVSKRNFKLAVDRNRVKRLMREAYRLNKSKNYNILIEQDEQYALMFIFVGNEIPDFAFVERKIINLLSRLNKEIKNSYTNI